MATNIHDQYQSFIQIAFESSRNKFLQFGKCIFKQSNSPLSYCKLCKPLLFMENQEHDFELYSGNQSETEDSDTTRDICLLKYFESMCITVV